MGKITLAQAMDAAPVAVYLDRGKAERVFGPGLFDRAVTHHRRRGLAANIITGTLKARGTVRAQYADYTWAAQYADAPHLVWFDFFRGEIMNSCSRMARGLSS